MLEQIVLLPIGGGEALTMPVTPASWQRTRTRSVNSYQMPQTGQVNLPGAGQLLSEELELLLPSEKRNYTAGDYNGDCWGIERQLESWCAAGTVVRFLITGTDVNEPVLIESVRPREQDGTGDLYVQLVLKGYRGLAAESWDVASSGGNSGRGSDTDTAGSAGHAKSHKVVSGDTLWAIARANYGDPLLAWALARYNGIKNANLIYVGQVVQLPDAAALKGA